MARTVRGRGRSQRGTVPFSEPQYRDLSERVGMQVATEIAPALATMRQRVSLPSDVSVTTATYASITGLSFDVIAGTTYHFQAQIGYTASTTAFNHAFSFTGPAATRYAILGLIVSSGNAVAFSSEAYDTGTTQSVSSQTTNAVWITGILLPSAAGTLTARFRSGGGNTVTAKAGSTLEYWTGA